MIVEAGQIALALAFIVSLYAAAASFLGVARRSPELLVSGRFGMYSIPALLIVATGALIYAFVNNDFSVRYVAENSSLAMPREYTWVAFYAGNAGSMLYLAVIFALMAVVAIAAIRKNLPYTSPYAVGIMALSLAFLLGVMLFLANPLARQAFTPMDGEGINPLLVHMGMFIHPPLQMAGLVSVAIPFSIAMGAMLAGKGGNDEWVDQGRLWGMISWLILTAGLLLGSWWAYTILGWGGYWAWDPVENSALMPWLAMTAFVHSIMVQKRRGMFRMWNMVIIIIAFTMAQLGMFINRGGPVPSVHSFAQSSMGWLFLAFMATTMIASIAAFVWKSDTLRSRGRLESALSRESAFLAQKRAVSDGGIRDAVGDYLPDILGGGERHGDDCWAAVLQPGQRPHAAVDRDAHGRWADASMAEGRSAQHPYDAALPGAGRACRGGRTVRDRCNPSRRADRIHDVRDGDGGHTPGVDTRDYHETQARRGVSHGFREAAVGEQAQIWRVRGASGHHNAGGGRDRVVVLLGTA